MLSMNGCQYECPCMERCPLHFAMERIGGKWKTQILCALTANGPLRYNALRARLDGISNTVLAAALKDLERDGLVARREYLAVPVRVEYSATPSAMRLQPILDALSVWGEEQMNGAY